MKRLNSDLQARRIHIFATDKGAATHLLLLPGKLRFYFNAHFTQKMYLTRWITRTLVFCTALSISACESAQDRIAQKEAASRTETPVSEPPDGMAVFRKFCVTCHGADGKLGLNGAKDLTLTTLTLEERINQITHGKNMMTPFEEVLSPAEIKAVAEYTLTLKKQ